MSYYDEEETYDCFNGSWAQDEQGYSDQEIWDIFGARLMPTGTSTSGLQ